MIRIAAITAIRAMLGCLLVLSVPKVASADPAQPAVASGTDSAAVSPVVQAAQTYLLAHLQRIRPDIDRFELTAASALPEPLSKGVRATAAAQAVHGDTLSMRTCVWMDVRRGNRRVGSVPVWFSVKAYRPVLVSTRTHAVREPLSVEDFTVEERDVAPLGVLPANVDSKLEHLRARHLLATGHVLLNSDLEESPQILQGQEVAVEVRYGTVAIQTNAVALREARLGEPVALQNPTSHMTYSARVVGLGRAAVIEQ